jgi:hypothetical protein
MRTKNSPPIGQALNILRKMIATRTNKCVLWPYSLKNQGFSTIWFEGKSRQVHAVAWALANNKPIPTQADGFVRRTCKQKICVNSRHLFLQITKPVGGRKPRCPHRQALPTLERLIAIKSKACIEWPYSRMAGYGALKIGERMWGAHVLGWTLLHGPIPDGLEVLHRCDNRPCVNVQKHLFLGTAADNIHDMVKKRRHAFGERNGFAKLTEDQVREIRTLNHLRSDEVAEMFGIEKSNVNLIRARKAWKHI